jgi:hypothetical protein
MQRRMVVIGRSWATYLTATVLSIALVGGLGVRTVQADTFSPQGDDWKGDKLDPKWHVTVMGDAQPETNEVQVNNGTLKIIAGGTDIWTDNDNGIFLWQPANGDFEAIIEIRSLKKISDSLNSQKVGIMVRPSLDNHSPHVYMIAMPKGTHIQQRAAVGDQAGPSSGDAGRLPWGDGSGNGPTMHMRLVREGNRFTASRSFDGGKTWERIHDEDHLDTDTVEVEMPDDVLMGIMVGAIHGADDTTLTEAVVGPFQFKQLATRPTDNGLVAAVAVDDNGQPVLDAGLTVARQDELLGTSITDVGPSNTASFFLKPGLYTIRAAESDTREAGEPVPFEIKTGVVEPKEGMLKVKVGKAK